ncbi:flagellar motor protein MotD [Marinobacterium sp. AK62]|uniref:Flagellar motor protein MotD n=1 Tax=Marinobacterium alkalitolerans TaxID=1542925 RepID=A0ABS3Z9X8_9GAMM|nr:flagellar motor protein MotD [Marinobacterium alkalitolerans]MBP0048503.1 flagellar motor protein MotD [Marinobacterium alkalitolerans]
MPRRRRPDTDLKTDRWMISWADFVTLLFAFFVVMYALSSVNEEKYRQLSQSLSQIFRAEGGTALVEGTGQGEGVLEGSQRPLATPDARIEPPDPEVTDQLTQMEAQARERFAQQIDAGQVLVRGNRLWVAIELNASLLFASGDAIPVIEADPLLQQVVELVQDANNPVHVEGFTDNQPISTERFPSNWELSAARAAAVVRLLQQRGIEPWRLAAVGYGQYQPAYSNRTEEGRQRNRRIVIVIARDERVRRAVQAYGSDRISDDAVNTLLIEQDREQTQQQEAAPTLEQVETDSGILFRQADPEQAQEQ